MSLQEQSPEIQQTPEVIGDVEQVTKLGAGVLELRRRYDKEFESMDLA